MALVSVIRRWYFREKLSIREISRRTSLSRNTIRKYLRSGETEPKYPSRQSASLLDDYANELIGWLHRETRKPRKQRRTVKQHYSELVKQGYTGSYDRVAAFARQWRREQSSVATRGTYVPLRFAPGEAFQFDWSTDSAVINGHRCKVQVAQFRLSHSRAFLLQAYPLQTHEMLFAAHNVAFKVFGGVPARGIYDNMKTAVDKIGRGKDRTVNRRFQAMANHYLFEPEFCNPAAGWEKGQIEKQVRDSRTRFWTNAPAFDDWATLNQWLVEQCQQQWRELKHPEFKDRTIAELWRDEVNELLYCPTPFDGFVESTKRVSPTCLVTVDRVRYSVPASFANRHTSVRLYASEVVVIAEGHEIARHERLIDRRHDRPALTVYDWRHYLTVVQRKPGALRNGAPFEDLPSPFASLQRRLRVREGGEREMVEILSLVLQHDENLVLRAVQAALELGHPSKQHVLNQLSRLRELDHERPNTLPKTPLVLAEEPQANVDRYDHLRETNDA